jgi:hypothetical protein
VARNLKAQQLYEGSLSSMGALMRDESIGGEWVRFRDSIDTEQRAIMTIYVFGDVCRRVSRLTNSTKSTELGNLQNLQLS